MPRAGRGLRRPLAAQRVAGDAALTHDPGVGAIDEHLGRGRVTEVAVKPHVPIEKGEVLFRIDPRPFEYAVRAVTPGTFAARPAEVYAMYRPEMWGRSASEAIGMCSASS